MQVKDLMSKRPVVVTPHDSIYKVKRIFEKRRIWTIYVVNELNIPIGVITRKDWLNRTGPSTKTVRSIMSNGAYTLNQNDDPPKAMSKLDSYCVNSLGVIDDKGQLVGVVTRHDLKNTVQDVNEDHYSDNDSAFALIFSFIKNVIVFALILGLILYLFFPNILFNILSNYQFNVKTNTNDYVLLDEPSAQTQDKKDTVPRSIDLPIHVNIAPFLSKTESPSPGLISAIYIPNDILNGINARFPAETSEFKYCLYGRRDGNSLIITEIKEPPYYSRTPMMANTEKCPSSSWGFIHSHPEAGCLLSDGDIEILKTEGFPIMGVMCEVNRFAFYTINNPQNTVKIYSTNLDNEYRALDSFDITPQTPCPGERYCIGRCWLGCTSHQIWTCTSNGGECPADPTNCPPGEYSCLGRCWLGCPAGQTWQCTSSGGMCILR